MPLISVVVRSDSWDALHYRIQSLICYRASLSHGTPPHIHAGQFDVAAPDLNCLLFDGCCNSNSIPTSDIRLAGAHSFVALCKLTEILGDILPLIYASKRRHAGDTPKALRRLEASLDEWQDSLPEWLNYNSPDFRRSSPGVLTLRCALEAPDDETARGCVASAQLLIDHLRKAKAESNWDLVDVCLSQCAPVVRQMNDGNYLDFRKEHAMRHSSSASRQNQRSSHPNPGTLGHSNNTTRPPRLSAGVSAHCEREESTNGATSTTLSGANHEFNHRMTSMPDLVINDTNLTGEETWDQFPPLLLPDIWQFSGIDGQ